MINFTKEEAEALRASRDSLGELPLSFLSDNYESNEQIAHIDRLIAMNEKNLAALRAERVKHVAISDYSMGKAIHFHKAQLEANEKFPDKKRGDE